jgi:hypothetical protein
MTVSNIQMQYTVLLFSYNKKIYMYLILQLKVQYEKHLKQSKECVQPNHRRISHSKALLNARVSL